MPDFEFDSQDKIVQQMSRDGLVQENLVTGEQENISSKKADFEYNPLKAFEKAINVSQEVHSYKKQYSSSGAEELEEDIPENESEYKSSYEQGNFKANKENASEEENKSNEEGEGKKAFNRQKNKTSDKAGSDADEEKKDFKFSRDKKAQPESERFERRNERKLERFDKKIEKADTRVVKRKNKLPARTKLKFEKSYSIDDKDDVKTTGRLKFEKERYTKRQYDSKKRNKKIKKRAREETTKTVGWRSWSQVRRDNRDDIHESELDTVKRVDYQMKKNLNKSVKNISNYSSPYARFQRAQGKADYYYLRRDEIEYKGLPKDQKMMQKQLQKKRYKKAAIQKSMEQGQQKILRHRNLFIRAKDAVMKFVKGVKTFFTIFSSVLTIIIILIALLIGIFILVAIAIGFGGESILRSTYQAGYDQISDCTSYMRYLETNLEERIGKIETEEYPDCYEYVYNLGEINHNAIELISYLAAKYIEFDLEKCRDEIESIFNDMYTLVIEVIEEPRERDMVDEYGQIIYGEDGNPVMETFMAKICYITLEVRPLDEIILERLDAEQKEAFDTYMLSSGGQQVYANCLPDDWSSLISSKFGERIHPITKERTFHNGVDIAVPEGTPLYSSAGGMVTTSAYSDTAGHYIIVTMDNGWSIKYMHLASRDVSAGDIIMRGQFLGETGNSGRSTGPHLHLEVRDANDNPIDPTFMIPSKAVPIIEKERE